MKNEHEGQEQEPIFGEVTSMEVAKILRERGVDAASVEFCWDDWDNSTGFVVRNERGVAVGEGSVLVVSDHEKDRILIGIHIGDVRPL